MEWLSIVGGGLGGVLRFVPEIIKLFTDKRDRDHELAMTRLQFAIDKARSKSNLDMVHMAGQMEAYAGEMQALYAAIETQGKLTGITWVDALNSTVRPFLTYWWMLLFTVYKTAMIYTGLSEYGFDAARLLPLLWTPDDSGILSMILGFWFVDRVFRKQQGN